MVDEIEPSLKLWINQLGFEKIVEVPEGDKLGFVILQKPGVEVMLQSRPSIRKDAGAAAEIMLKASSHLYIEVEDFADVLKRVAGAEVVVPERTTFYGMREIWIREAGYVLGFAARSQAPAQA